MAVDNIYHEGELAVQERANESRMAQMNAGSILDRIPGIVMGFVEQQPMVAVGSLDGTGRVWASLVFGTPGFLRVENGRTLALNQAECHTAKGDPLWENLETNPRLGMLLIEPATRRRLRVNGEARRVSDGSYVIDVERAYANCPKYIQARRWQMPEVEAPTSPGPSRHGEQLNVAQQAWIGNADTFFVASAHPEQGVDASHRGGRSGFVKVLSPHRLRIPDFAGNSMFNTLGNFTCYPNAGLVFLDFERGRILQLTGRPELFLGEQHMLGETGGTARYWEFEVEAWRESKSPLPIAWQFVDYSPFIPNSEGPGKTADAELKLRIERMWSETSRIKGFQLRSADGAPLPAFEPGAHLPVSVRLRNGEWVQRNYSLLSDPANRIHYRIGVLAELQGRGGSLYLHESVKAGDMLETMTPRNGFPLDIHAEHSILLAGGIGITPLLSMLHTLKAENKSCELHYSARSLTDLAFRANIERLAGEQAHFYASDEPGEERIDMERILAEPAAGVHIYVCGPRPMIIFVRDLAQARGWPTEQIHFESFGVAASPQDRELTVTLAKNGKKLVVPASSSILDALLDAGVAVPHDCKRGECSLCITRVLDGIPEHRDLCLSAEERSESLCTCVSRAEGDGLTLDL